MFSNISGSFPKSRRLRKRVDYLKVQNSGNSKNSRYFVLVWKRKEETVGRIGITVSKKVGNAVVRNRIKRVVREFVRTRRIVCTKSPTLCEGPAMVEANTLKNADSWLPQGLDVVVIAKKSAAGKSTKLLWEDLEAGKAWLQRDSGQC